MQVRWAGLEELRDGILAGRLHGPNLVGRRARRAGRPGRRLGVAAAGRRSLAGAPGVPLGRWAARAAAAARRP